MAPVVPPAPPATPRTPTVHLADRKTRAAFRAKVGEYARGAVGYIEGKGNLTPFGAWLGLNGLPWCISFVAYVYAAAAAAVGCENPLAGIQTRKGPGGATELARIGRARGWALDDDELPMVGDLALWDHDAVDGGPGHGGIVVGVRQLPDGSLEVTTVEGNTSRSAKATKAEARNGGEVAVHRHTLAGGGRPSHGRFLVYLRPTRRFGR